ncbi:uncharacterized protein F4822DRAFT_383787 [Hypoxylon trugodes]|uniref:uncharacterized protein n=1 Tax=Hypoxylon trugodes TaxID=326681 RepID=UPI00218CCBC1|nr:uncharacterized protein F4822DRAFT_383787 [Hypoxylon trugodes]KAI1393183.1 hypothetical protein F4822DRAFT_383787 [Hypoxylon trugodes]
MDGMNIFDGLELLAFLAEQSSFGGPDVDRITIGRWQHLFGYTHDEAVLRIHQHRTDFTDGTRMRVTESHWRKVRAKKEVAGHDWESFEHECNVRARTAGPSSQRFPKKKEKPIDPDVTYFLKIEWPFTSVEQVQEVAGLSKPPLRLDGNDDEGEPTTFCGIDDAAKDKVLAWLERRGYFFEPMLIPYSLAKKNLSSTSVYPTLGVDTTLPQHRLNSLDDPKLSPAQDQHPVWYFFYDDLADRTVLSKLLDIQFVLFNNASVTGGTLKTGVGENKVLVDSPNSNEKVSGQAYLAFTKDEEECIRLYKTAKYEIVRCEIQIEGIGTKQGLTFRYVGEVDP